MIGAHRSTTMPRAQLPPFLARVAKLLRRPIWHHDRVLAQVAGEDQTDFSDQGPPNGRISPWGTSRIDASACRALHRPGKILAATAPLTVAAANDVPFQ